MPPESAAVQTTNIRHSQSESFCNRPSFYHCLAFADIEDTENWEWFFRNLLRTGGMAKFLTQGKVSGECVMSVDVLSVY